MEDNRYCSVCSTRSAQVFCICERSLPALCSSADCMGAHEDKRSLNSHFFLPPSARIYITSENYVNCVVRTVKMKNAQSNLFASLLALDDSAKFIEEFFMRIVTAIVELKSECISKVDLLREAANEAFKNAERETAQNVLNSEYVPQGDVEKWIWEKGASAEGVCTPLFHRRVDYTTPGAISALFEVKVDSEFQSLERWHLDKPGRNYWAQREELERLKAEVEAQGERIERFERIFETLREELTNCQQECEKLKAELSEKVSSDAPTAVVRRGTHWQTPDQLPTMPYNTMEPLLSDKLLVPENSDPVPTKRSTQSNNSPGAEEQLAALNLQEESKAAMPIATTDPTVSPSRPQARERSVVRTCKTCGSEFRPVRERLQCPNSCQCEHCTIENTVARKSDNCVHCRNPFDPNAVKCIRRWIKRCHTCEIALHSSCFPKNASCKVCIYCVEVRGTTATCSKCRSDQFALNEAEVESVRRKEVQFACCPNAKGDRFKAVLPCGHLICKVHELTLSRCRQCWNEVR